MVPVHIVGGALNPLTILIQVQLSCKFYNLKIYFKIYRLKFEIFKTFKIYIIEVLSEQKTDAFNIIKYLHSKINKKLN